MRQPWPELDPLLAAASERFGTPAYLYSADRIEARLARLGIDFGRWFKLSYAMKANPNPVLLRWLLGRVPMLDVSSLGEVRLALANGWSAADLSFTGPAKREAEIAEAIAAGIGDIVLESLDEADLANRLAIAAGVQQRVLVRLAPDRVPKGFGDQMAGRCSPFGIDVEVAEAALRHIAALPGLRISGLHIYSGTQSLRPDAIAENWRIFIACFQQFCVALDMTPERLVFGSGLGIPYHAGDTHLDTAAVSAAISPDLDALRADPRFGATELVLELGRHLVGEAGVFLTRVVRTKTSRGSRIALCDGGLNAHLAATGQFGMVLRRNYMLHRVGGGEPTEVVNLHGPLCTSIDKLATGAMLPPIAEGDVIAIHASGAYGASASPAGFISHPAPREIWAEHGHLSDITR
ncbi:MAG: decarboxylase [Alphaproteobacteria bacterium]|nr:MAG: decarboxylase [Alphaproteobacteria bacterium]